MLLNITFKVEFFREMNSLRHHYRNHRKIEANLDEDKNPLFVD